MSADVVLAERDGAVGIARLNRPDARNALSAEVFEALGGICEAWDADPEVHCIVIAGDDDYFAAGADIKGMRDRSFQEAMASPSASFWPKMAAVRTPLVAAVSGYALGGGCELALLCDLIVASETAEFGQPEIMLGIIPGGGGTQRLARVLGKHRAMELVLTGRRIDAQEAYAFGLVNQVTKKKDWLDKAVELAQVVARRPPIAARLAKQAVLAGGRDEPVGRARARAPPVRDRDGHRGPCRGHDRVHREAPPRLQGQVTGVAQRIGVVGAGTMGAGIAQLGVQAGMETWLHDPFAEALERGERYIRRYAESAADEHLRTAADLDELRDCDLVVEAAPERPDLKRELFERLSEVCGPDTILATNTSSILVTSLAGAAAEPANVVGMHFFNPPPLMKLLEVIAAEQTGERALEVARATGEAMGKRVIVVRDGPGFLVNRCGRPFGAEALRLLQEGIATHEQIDRIVRMGGGFRMGPFELMDLVGIDVGLEVAKSFDAQSFGEPRWKPSPLQARKVAAGTLGRKTGGGWYEYADDGSYRPDDPEPPEPGGGAGERVAIDGSGALAVELRDRARAAGFDARVPGDFGGADEPGLVVDASVPAPAADLGGADGGPPLAAVCADRSLAARGDPAAAGFHVLPPLEDAKLVELTRLPTTPDATAETVESFFARCGFACEWVGDAPGLVLGRIGAQLVNEAAFAIGEGVGSADAVDDGMRYGLNYPRGPVAWGRAIGFDHVLATIDGLWDDLRDPRYRAAPLLRRGGPAWPPLT